ncbi:uncharacterized protein LOC135398492 isoform X2 [Ornithodoros turicata]|uniref:uncharacterized protein LOC135398492 isoform X2 n=1 Tax=Ornithodoros turicata TaxID=34597 RepID=UPI0031389818
MAPVSSKQQETHKMSKTYTVVKFTQGQNETVEFVPTKWIVGGKLCLWPAGKPNSRFTQMIKDRCDPEDDWTLCACVCMASFNTESSEEEDAGTQDTGPADVIPPPRKRLRLPSPPCDVIHLNGSPRTVTPPPPPSSGPVAHLPPSSSRPVTPSPLPSSVWSSHDAPFQGHCKPH